MNDASDFSHFNSRRIPIAGCRLIVDFAPMEPIAHTYRPTQAILRKGRVSIAGQTYLVTFNTHDRLPLFADNESALAVARSLSDRRLWASSKLLAWTLMPDHWHGLIELGPLDDLSCRVGALKTNTARALRRANPDIGKVWAPAFHDRALRQEDNLLTAARYLVMNPVRAGLVRRIGDYPFWNAVWV
jgi:REP element-mobilizing transposase RayT